MFCQENQIHHQLNLEGRSGSGTKQEVIGTSDTGYMIEMDATEKEHEVEMDASEK